MLDLLFYIKTGNYKSYTLFLHVVLSGRIHVQTILQQAFLEQLSAPLLALRPLTYQIYSFQVTSYRGQRLGLIYILYLQQLLITILRYILVLKVVENNVFLRSFFNNKLSHPFVPVWKLKELRAT